MPILEVKELFKQYKNLYAVRNVSFSVEAGEIFGFLGPNGAGKTTTINMITGLAKPTSGSITLAGIDCIKSPKAVQRIIGIVPDESNLYDDMNGFDNLCFCASLYGMEKKKREKKAHSLLAEFNLEKAANRPFKTYSKGMKRKLTIAAGLIHNPKVLFMDEPTTGIDVESAKQIRERVANLKLYGTTVFLTTHYIEEAQRLCDRIAFIVNGQIVQINSVKELLKSAEAGKHVVQFAMNGMTETSMTALTKRFPHCSFEMLDNGCLCRSSEPISLFPIMHFLEESGITVHEARLRHPSLEDVFVKITGIEPKKLTSEKEGERK